MPNNTIPGDPNLPGGCTNKMHDAHMGGPDLGEKACPDCEGDCQSHEPDCDKLWNILADIRIAIKESPNVVFLKENLMTMMPSINAALDCPTCKGEGVVDKTAEDVAEDRAAHAEAQWDARNDR